MDLVHAKPVLDSFLFQIIYGSGYTYLDRCGQTLVDIERARFGWTPGEVSPFVGNIANEALRMSMTFNVDRFDFNASRATDVAVAAEEAQALWNVVRENLNLTEYVRVACRFQWLLAKASTEDAEKALSRAGMQVSVPPAWSEAGFGLSTRTMAAVLRRESMEYRVALQTVTRVEGVLPSTLVTVDPRMLPAGRRQAQKDAIKNRQNYNANPTYAVNLDLDCVTYAPTNVKPGAYITEQFELARKQFVPVLEGL